MPDPKTPADPTPTSAQTGAPDPAPSTQPSETPAKTPPVEQQSAAKTKPEGLDDRYWDAAAGDVKLADLVRDTTETSTKLATYESRAARVPAEPKDYGFGLPKDFKLEGEGLDKYEIELKEDHPLIPRLQDFAKRTGLTPEEYQEAVGLAVQLQASMYSDAASVLKGQSDRLGANAPQRIDNVTKFLNGMIGAKADALVKGLWTADQITAVEALMDVFRRQGLKPPTTTTRDDPSTTRSGPQWDSRDQLGKLRAARAAMKRETPQTRR